MDMEKDTKHLIICVFLRFFDLVVWQTDMKLGAALGYQALDFVPVPQNPEAVQPLTN